MSPQFGKQLRTLRKDAGISAVEMVKRSGLTRSQFYRIEAGELEPNTEMVNALAKGIGIEPEELYELAWTTNGTGPGLPSPATYFRNKYQLDDTQIATLEKELAKITKQQETRNQP